MERNDHLAAARAAKKDPWTLQWSLARHKVHEAERLQLLTADEQMNPGNYCKRVHPLPNIDICGKCNAVGTLVMEQLDHFVVWTCPVCGTCYYPDVEPIPRTDLNSTAGRHHSLEPGEHFNDYDSTYRKTKKGKKNATT